MSSNTTRTEREREDRWSQWGELEKPQFKPGVLVFGTFVRHGVSWPWHAFVFVFSEDAEPAPVSNLQSHLFVPPLLLSSLPPCLLLLLLGYEEIPSEIQEFSLLQSRDTSAVMIMNFLYFHLLVWNWIDLRGDYSDIENSLLEEQYHKQNSSRSCVLFCLIWAILRNRYGWGFHHQRHSLEQFFVVFVFV